MLWNLTYGYVFSMLSQIVVLPMQRDFAPVVEQSKEYPPPDSVWLCLGLRQDSCIVHFQNSHVIHRISCCASLAGWSTCVDR